LCIQDKFVKGLRDCSWLDLTRTAGTHKSIPKEEGKTFLGLR
jgi:hypothetical protein